MKCVDISQSEKFSPTHQLQQGLKTLEQQCVLRTRTKSLQMVTVGVTTLGYTCLIMESYIVPSSGSL